MSKRPQPTQLKILRGNPGKRPLNETEPMPKAGKPEPLDSLTPAARVHFARLVDQLDAVKVVTVNDGAAVSALAQSIADYEEATRALTSEGKIVVGQRGYQRNPWVMIQKQAWEQMHRGFSEFGLTASSRSKIHTLPKGADDDEERFFGT